MEMFHSAGLVVKLVLVILFSFSVISWAIIAMKSIDLFLAKRDTARFLKLFYTKLDFYTTNMAIGKFKNSPLVALFRAVYADSHENSTTDQGRIAKAVDSKQGGQERITRILRRATTTETQKLERFLAFLATTASAAPFIGLFGTVWGIMDAFHEIGKSGSASLAVVAPGISEALVATAIGLIAAIPAVVAYNHLLNKVNVLIGEMDNFSQDILNIAQRLPGNYEGE